MPADRVRPYGQDRRESDAKGISEQAERGRAARQPFVYAGGMTTVDLTRPVEGPFAWHATPAPDVLSELETDRGGLGAEDAARRLAEHGPNVILEQAPRVRGGCSYDRSTTR